MPVKKGDTLKNRYLIRDRIGSGGFSVVYLAEDTQLRTSVAVKVFAPHQGLDSEGLQNFADEYKLTQRLDHPNLMKASDYFVVGESPCMVFPYMPHGSLYKKLAANGPVEEKEVARILAHISAGLAYMHGLLPAVLHNDVKPENVLINYGRYILTDFGISTEMRSTLMRSSNLAGQTMQYISPEGVLRKPISSYSDIFALGVVLYELTTGLMKSNLPPGQLIAFGQSVPVLETEKYSGRLNELITVCLRQEPGSRPTASQLSAYAQSYLREGYWPEIKEAASGEGAAPVPPPPSPRQTTVNTKSPPPAPLALAGGSLGAGLGVSPEENKEEQPKKKKRGAAMFITLAVLMLLGGGGYAGYNMHVDKTYIGFVNSGSNFLTMDYYGSCYEELNKAMAYLPEREEALQVMEELREEVGEHIVPELQHIDTLLAAYSFPEAEAGIASLRQTYGAALPEDSITRREEDLRFLPLVMRGDSAMEIRGYAEAIASYDEALGVRLSEEVERKRAEADRLEKAERLAAVNARLKQAVKANDENAVLAALEEGAQVDMHLDGGPLTLTAIKKNNLGVLRALIGKGADPDNTSGSIAIGGDVTVGSPLVAAATLGKIEMVRFLVEEAGAGIDKQEYDPETKKTTGWAPLHGAAYYGRMEVARYLIAKGAAKDRSVSTRLLTPLMLAARNKQGDMMEYLIGQGANVNHRDADGWTSLHLTARLGYSRGVKVLTNADASCTIKTNNGAVAFQLAQASVKRLLTSCTPVTLQQYELVESYDSGTKLYSEIGDEYITMKYRSSSLEVSSNVTNRLGASMRSMPVSMDSDFEYEAKFKLVNIDGRIQTGLVIGAEGRKRYYFTLTSSSTWALKSNDGNYVTLESGSLPRGLAGTSSMAFKVIREGSYLTCYINNKQVARERISRYFGNQFGVCVSGKCNGRFTKTIFKGNL